MPVSLALAALIGVLSGCSLQAAPTNEPVAVATRFISAYDEWAQTGYQDPIPEPLRSLASKEMIEVLESDQRWHANGKVVQHGAVQVTDAVVLESSDQRAVVRVELDARDVSVTAGGESTYVDYSQPIITKFSLQREGEWRVTSTSSDG